MGFEYESASDDYLSENLDPTLREYLYVPCYNLSTILSDTAGKINHSTVKRVTGNLTITAPGIVLPGHGITEYHEDEVTHYDDGILGQEKFIWEVGPRAYSLYLRYLIMDPMYTAPTKSTTTVTSPLLYLSEGLRPKLRNSIDSLYLEVITLYTELVEVRLNEKLPTLTLQDVIRILGNIRYVSRELEQLPSRNYNLIQVLRDLQVTVMTISNIKQIFSVTYASRISNMSDLGGGIDG